MMKKLYLILRFYRQSMMLIAVLLTSWTIYVGLKNNHYESFSTSAIIAARQLIFVLLIYFVYQYKKKEFTYYRNLGLSWIHILIVPMLIDCLISTIIIYQIVE